MDSISYSEKLNWIKTHNRDGLFFPEVLKRENQKIYPFYYLTNFFMTVDQSCICDYCKDSFGTNMAGYFTAYVVWESAEDIRLCCNVYHCRKGHILDYHKQIYGYKTPVELGRYSDSIKHILIHSVLLHGSYAYQANKYIKNGITHQQLDKEFPLGTGGFSQRGKIKGWVEYKPGRIILSDNDWKPQITLTKSDIVRLFNEILKENHTYKQLTLF